MASYTGNEAATQVAIPTSPTFFDFQIPDIKELLGRSHPTEGPARGVRFHFDQARPMLPTQLYVAATGRANDMVDPSPAHADVFKANGSSLTSTEFENVMSGNGALGNKAGSCVYFSKSVLENQLLSGNIPDNSGQTLRLIVVEQTAFPDLFNLVAVRIDGNGQPQTVALLSDHPCPPSCNEEYSRGLLV
jgi:hypothetical protein